MAKRIVGVLGVVLTVLVLGASQASAQNVNVDVSFTFIAGDSELPPGSYQIRAARPNGKLLSFKNTSTGAISEVAVATRIADIGASEPSLVFDVADGKRYLSEVHMPNQDGYLIAGAKGEHMHEKVKGKQ